MLNKVKGIAKRLYDDYGIRVNVDVDYWKQFEQPADPPYRVWMFDHPKEYDDIAINKSFNALDEAVKWLRSEYQLLKCG